MKIVFISAAEWRPIRQNLLAAVKLQSAAQSSSSAAIVGLNCQIVTVEVEIDFNQGKIRVI